jgi:hypothetical protein
MATDSATRGTAPDRPQAEQVGGSVGCHELLVAAEGVRRGRTYPPQRAGRGIRTLTAGCPNGF